GIGSLLVWLQADDEESLVRRGDTVDEVEPHHRKYALDAGDGSDDVLHPLHYCTRAVDRGALRQAHRGEESSLVFLRQEALWGHAEKPGRAHKYGQHGNHADDRDTYQSAHGRDIAVAGTLDAAQHVAHRPFA